MDKSFRDRFWAKVEKTETCWIWIGAHNGRGYGHMNLSAGKARKYVGAHRIAWEMENGPIPAGMYVLHTCDNPPCVRASHLYVGTQSQNIRDAYQRGRKVPAMQKVTDEQVLEIRALRGRWLLREIAEEYKLTRQHVSDIMRGKYRTNLNV